LPLRACPEVHASMKGKIAHCCKVQTCLAPAICCQFFSERVINFLRIVYQAIASLDTRFEQYKEYEDTFGFLFTSDRLQSLDDKCLRDACV
jgi:hypothetical protein